MAYPKLPLQLNEPSPGIAVQPDTKTTLGIPVACILGQSLTRAKRTPYFTSRWDTNDSPHRQRQDAQRRQQKIT